ncbi:hypothetical protein [Parasediminibacterium sp. JCM 36343]|uniref:hypothetical protein n=1 Tax=Parasediminibacterium sp. JCM 36343 TaxID=3374279 RepID=UPI00397C4C37
MKSLSPVDKFGKFIVENLRDKGIDFAEGLLKNLWKAPSLLKIQNEIATLNDNQKIAFIKAITQTMDGAIHDFLFALQEQADFDNDIQILVDGQNVVELSDGIHGEAYSDEGWFAKYSRHKSDS